MNLNLVECPSWDTAASKTDILVLFKMSDMSSGCFQYIAAVFQHQIVS